ncbi:T9SS type A sorting domain-containing protein [Nibrella viscosa]|uniref:T9SS type A sorting domain-containing protein n=1 Tax=Nibrella viscosa TaxID=1084524 RepID=UPI0031F12DF8
MSSTSALCHGGTGSIVVAASGGTAPYSYTITKNGGGYTSSNGDGQFGGLYAGNYTITVKDANGCPQSVTANVAQPAEAVYISHTTSTSVACFGGSTGTISATALGGVGSVYSYTLTGTTVGNSPVTLTSNNGTFTGLAAGTYTVKASDANGCESQASGAITINQPTQVTLSSVTSTSVTCFSGTNGALSVSASGGTGAGTYSYTLTPGNVVNTTGTFNNLAAGSYTISVKDANGCTSTAPAAGTVVQPTQVTLSSVTSTSVTCFSGTNGALSVSASGGTGAGTYSYTLTPGNVVNTSGTFNNLAAGSYTISVKDANGCTSTAPAAGTVVQPTQVTLSSVTSTSVTCFSGTNGALSVSASGGTGAGTYSYTLTPGNVVNTSGTFNNLAAGSYTISVKDANGCTSTAPAAGTVVQPTALTVSAAAGTIACFSGTTSLTATASGGNGNYMYSLNGGTPQSSNVFSGIVANTNYTVTVTSNGACPTVTNTVSVTQPTAVAFNPVSVTNVSCNGGSTGAIAITASGGVGPYSYTLTPGNTVTTTGSFTGLSAGTNYVVTVKDAKGCQLATSPISVTQPTQVTYTTTSTNVTCQGGSQGRIDVSAAGGGSGTYSFTVTNGSAITQTGTTSGAFSATGLTAGTYTVQVRNSLGCVGSGPASVTITQPSTAPSATQTPVVTCVKSTTLTSLTITTTVSNASVTPTYSWSYKTSSSGTPISLSNPSTTTINVGNAQNPNIFRFVVNGNQLVITALTSGKTLSDLAGYIFSDFWDASCNNGTTITTLDGGAQCTPQARVATIEAITAEPTVPLQMQLSASPNPTSDVLNVTITGAGEQKVVPLKLYNVMQRVVGEWPVEISNGQGKATIDIREQATGVYILSAEGDKQRATQRIMKSGN